MITNAEIESLIRSAASAAVAGGELIRSEFGRPFSYRRSGKYDLKLGIDVASEDLIARELRHVEKGSNVISEEQLRGAVSKTGVSWVVDPLDGTNNFASGIAYLAVSIGVVVDGRLEGAVLHDPITRLTVTAYSGSGLRDGRVEPFRRLQPVRDRSLSECAISLVTDYSAAGREDGYLKWRLLNEHARRVLTMWAPGADLLHLALGQLDGIVCNDAAYEGSSNLTGHLADRS